MAIILNSYRNILERYHATDILLSKRFATVAYKPVEDHPQYSTHHEAQPSLPLQGQRDQKSNAADSFNPTSALSFTTDSYPPSLSCRIENQFNVWRLQKFFAAATR